MTNTALETPWQNLLELFRSSNNLTKPMLVDSIKALTLPKNLTSALEASIKGNNRAINEHLFNLPVTHQEPIAWIAPVLVGSQKTYAWMVGQVSPEIPEIRAKFRKASSAVREDQLLMCSCEPKPLMFLDPFAVSSFSDIAPLPNVSNSNENGDFAIFQVGYKDKTGDIEDFDQSLVLNSTLLEQNFNSAIQVAVKVLSEVEQIDVHSLIRKARLFSMCHAEAHNRGHFAGAWSFDNQKNCLLHEAVEEFRACLNAIRWSEHLGFSSDEMDLFAFSVFAVRFFHYGYKAYIDPLKTHQTVREISVGLMFFEILRQANVFYCDGETPYLQKFDISLVKPALISALEKLNQQESNARLKGVDGLREVGRYWYQLAYPHADLSPEAQSLYTFLRAS